MANTLTDLLPDIYEGLEVVSREAVGMIPAVNGNHTIERAAKNETVRVPLTRAHSAVDATPAQIAPDNGDTTVDNVSMTINKFRAVPVRFSGEDQKGLSNGGVFTNIRANRFAQAMRTLVNEIETDLWTEAYQSASRAYGTAGTTPFGTAGDLSDLAGVARILDENGAPKGDRQLVIGHAALANLRGKQSVLFKVNEAGSTDMLREGMTDRLQGMALRHSDAVGVHTKGTGTSYQLSAALAVGDTTVNVDTGSGTLLAGDIVTFAGTSDKYVANTTLSGGVFTIGRPGSLAVEADNDAVSIGNSYTANLAFDRSAIHLATRMIALPDGGDQADDVVQVTDPFTGLTFEIASYGQYLQRRYEVRLAWGVLASQSEHIALMIG